MKKLMAVGLILFLSLSLGNAVSVIAQEELFDEEGVVRPHMGFEEGRQGWRQHFDFGAVTQEEEDEALRYMEKNRPEEFERLTRLKKRNPLMYQGILGRIIRGIHFLEDLKKEDPERYKRVVHIKELEQESRRLAEKYEEIDDPEEKETIKTDLKNLLSDIFDLRQKEREVEIERLRKELERLQEKIIRRRENKETIVNRRLKEMTGEADYLQW